MTYLRWGAAAVVCAMTAASTLLLGSACGGRTEHKLEEIVQDAGSDAPFDAGALPPERTSEKLDVLFVIDNTLTAAPAQSKLARTIPYLMDRLTRPACVNGFGQVIAETVGLQEPCPVGVRDFAPVQDLHMAVITTSLGGHGADTCSPALSTFHPEQDEGARLISRDAGGGTVPTYSNLGFLVWDPLQERQPPGDADVTEFQTKLGNIIAGAGIRGCGFESPLEAFYRFLIDPEPYESIPIVDGSATPTGVDELVLQQRASFLRPDSALLVVMLTDEDDCSVIDGGQFYFINQSFAGNQPFHMPRARSECAVDPNDPCCASCGQAPPQGCAPDPVCDQGAYTEAEDPINLRCFDQKRRFGIDFLQPIERYVSGLQDEQISDRLGNPIANPLFVGTRGHNMVMVAALAGVPWQDIARSPGDIAAGFLPATEMPWERILGDPATNTPPEDPLMIPSRAPRTGTNPVINAELQPPTAGYLANPINGHEHSLSTTLQYACVYQLPVPIACDMVMTDCECNLESYLQNPVCQSSNGEYGPDQTHGRANPGTRQLTLVRDLGAQGILGSICMTPHNLEAAPEFGFKASVDAIMRRVRYAIEPFDDSSDN